MAKGPNTILLVEDDEEYLSRRKTELEQRGYVVLTATCVDAAVKVFKENQKAIIAIISDMTLPVKNPTDDPYERGGYKLIGEIQFGLESDVLFILNSRDTSAKLREYERDKSVDWKVLDKQRPIQDFLNTIQALARGV
jgi:CheY-like chemotaxis protein